MLVTLIIDRVGNTNVFNLIRNNQVHAPEEESEDNLQAVIDDDLIHEFQEELNRIASISRSLSHLPESDSEKQAVIFQHLNLNTRLKQIGEAFFRQFFPESLQKFLRENGNIWLSLRVAASLASIPFEILHDGEAFLWEKYYLGKSVKGTHSAPEKIEPKENLNMLIIADPTEDLEWARKEGESIFEHLSGAFPEKKLHIELMGGRNLNKLNLLNALIDKDIVHYSGHLHYTGSPEDNGWTLFDGKILHAREIKKSGAEPMLIFSNSCISGRSGGSESTDVEGEWYTQFASSFLKTPRTAYIGTNWDVPDNEPTIKFTIRLYEEILQGATLGEALRSAREFARENFALNDLTWASYMLMGNPQSRIFESDSKIPDVASAILNDDIVTIHFPFPVAKAFFDFREEARKNPDDSASLLARLFDLYDELVYFLGGLLYANAIFLKVGDNFAFPYPKTGLILDQIFKILGAFRAIHARPLMSNLMEVLYTHRDALMKVENWKGKFQKEAENFEVESHLVTVQYYLEGFLTDLEAFRNYGLYKIIEPGTRQLSLNGIREHHRVKDILLPTQTDSSVYHEIAHKTESLMGKCVFYNPIKRTFIDLSDVIAIVPTDEDESTYSLVYQKAP